MPLRTARPVLTLLFACTLVTALPLRAQEPHDAAAPTPAAGAKDPAAGPVEKLFEERKFQDALLEAEKLRKASGKPMGNPDDEFFAARSENALKLYDAARKPFQ